MQDWESKIDEIMDHFDFGRVAKAMVALDWVWTGTENTVPDEPEIRQHARSLLWSVVEDSHETIAIHSGGLEASKDGGTLNLKFVAEDWSAGEVES